MTIEEKAKAYDEAIKKAKEIKEKIVYSHLSTESCKAVSEYIDTIIPELCESEDERIRRTLVEYFGPKVQLDFVRGVPIQKIRDWLEKQKENPKSADSIPEDCASDAKCEDRWHKTANSLPNTGRDVLAKDALGNYLLASFDGAQWFVSVYDGQDHPVLHTPPILEWCEIPSEKQKDSLHIPEMCKENADSFTSEQKPAEWSEDDDQLIGFIFDLLNDLFWRKDWAMSKEECLERLKSLRPQPHTVSVENATKFGNLEYERGVKDGIQSEKSHQWKPSEEQMNGLAHAINLDVYDAKRYELDSLYNDLKKLM